MGGKKKLQGGVGNHRILQPQRQGREREKLGERGPSKSLLSIINRIKYTNRNASGTTRPNQKALKERKPVVGGSRMLPPGGERKSRFVPGLTHK